MVIKVKKKVVQASTVEDNLISAEVLDLLDTFEDDKSTYALSNSQLVAEAWSYSGPYCDPQCTIPGCDGSSGCPGTSC